MSRIKLSKYQEPSARRWEEVGLSECYDYYPEKEFYYFNDSKPVKIGEMEYMDTVLLQFFATKEDIIKSKSDKVFRLDEEATRNRLIHNIWSLWHNGKVDTLECLSEKVENDHNKHLDKALEHFKSLDHNGKVEKFKLDYPKKFKAWCNDKNSDMPIRKMSDDRLDKLYAHCQKGDYQLLYDVMPLDDLVSSIQDFIDQNNLSLTKKAEGLYGKRLYSYEYYFSDEKESWLSKKIRSFHKNIAWKKFMWWQKHVLFNTAEYVSPCSNDKIESLSDLYYRVRYQILHFWNKYIKSESPLIGYIDGPFFFTEFTENALTSMALYMFYFGHVVHATQRKHIREMWEARRLIRRASNLNDSSFSKEIEEKVQEDWENGISALSGKVNPMSVRHMSYFVDTGDGTGCSEMKSTWIADVTGLNESERKSIRKKDSRFGNCITKKSVKGQLFAELAVDLEKEYVELNDDLQETLEKDRSYYFEKWNKDIYERVENAYKSAYNFIGKNLQGWWD